MAIVSKVVARHNNAQVQVIVTYDDETLDILSVGRLNQSGRDAVVVARTSQSRSVTLPAQAENELDLSGLGLRANIAPEDGGLVLPFGVESRWPE